MMFGSLRDPVATLNLAPMPLTGPAPADESADSGLPSPQGRGLQIQGVWLCGHRAPLYGGNCEWYDAFRADRSRARDKPK